MKDIKRNHMIQTDLIIDKVETEMVDIEKEVTEKAATTEKVVTDKEVIKITEEVKENNTDPNIRRNNKIKITEVTHLLRIVLKKTQEETLTTDRSMIFKMKDLSLFKESQRLRIHMNHKSILESNTDTKTKDLMSIDS